MELTQAVEDALLDGLARLIATRGAQPFLAAPLLEPSPQFFPDRFTPDLRGVRTLARRLLTYAGLRGLMPEVHLDESGGAHGDRAAWFAGINLGRCVVGVREDLLEDPEALVAALCHEVTHAWRAVYDLADPDSSVEEPLTDLTTVYLGFGVLTANAAYRYRTSGTNVGHASTFTAQEHRLGYLAPEEMSFLLAAQAVARGYSRRQRSRVKRLLEANQAGWFWDACARLEKVDLRARLQLPAATPAPEALPPLTPIEDRAPAALHDALPARPPSSAVARAGHISFRVIQRRTVDIALKWAGLYILAAVVLELIVTYTRPDERAPAGSLYLLLPAVIAFIGGGLRGWRIRDDRCADCDGHLPLDTTSCPECGGVLRGTLKNRSERLSAREALEGTPPEPSP